MISHDFAILGFPVFFQAPLALSQPVRVTGLRALPVAPPASPARGRGLGSPPPQKKNHAGQKKSCLRTTGGVARKHDFFSAHCILVGRKKKSCLADPGTGEAPPPRLMRPAHFPPPQLAFRLAAPGRARPPVGVGRSGEGGLGLPARGITASQKQKPEKRGMSKS